MTVKCFLLKTMYHATLPLICLVLLCGCTTKAARGEHIRLAAEAVERLDYGTAVAEAEMAVVAGEDARYAYRLMGVAYMKNAAYREAIGAFETSLSRSDGILHEMDFDMNMYIAYCYNALGEYESALRIYGNMLALRPSDTEILTSRGETLLMTGALQEATASFDRAIELSPRDFDLRVRICRAYENAGYTEAGRSVLHTALQSYGNAMSYYDKGLFAFYMGNNGEAQSHLEKALAGARDAERARVVLLLGQTGERQGDLNYAIATYSDLLDQDPSHAEIFNRRGVCYMLRGEYTAAVADFEAGLALHDESVHQALLRNEIAAYESAGDFARAKALMDSYLALYPDDAEAVREAEFLSTR